jgi:hypothetical protein
MIPVFLSRKHRHKDAQLTMLHGTNDGVTAVDGEDPSIEKFVSGT